MQEFYKFPSDLRERIFAALHNLPLKVRPGEDWRDALRRQVAATSRNPFMPQPKEPDAQ